MEMFEQWCKSGNQIHGTPKHKTHVKIHTERECALVIRELVCSIVMCVKILDRKYHIPVLYSQFQNKYLTNV